MDNSLKYPSIGLFVSFKVVIEMFIYIFKCVYRGFLFVFKDIPTSIWNRLSGGVEKATISNTQKENETKEKKTSVLNMDINSLLKNTKYMKKKEAELEKQKQLLAEELQGSGAIRTKESNVYRFTAKKNGKLVTETINGFSKLDVNTFLVQDGYDVYKIETNKYINFLYGQSSILSPKLKNKDLLFWLTQLSTYIKAGITLTDSLRILNEQMGKKSKSYKRAFQSIVYELTMGESFSTALEKQGTMFPALLINMIRAAEATGELQETLDDMSEYYDETEKTRKQMKSALTYPSIILVFSLAVVTFILVWVIPQFVSIYDSAGAEINGFTLAILNMSDYLQNHLITIILAIALVIFSFYMAYKKVKVFRKNIQILMMKFPVIGNTLIYSEMTIFSKTFASLLRNNVFITDSITILSKITNNEVYKEIMYNTIDNIVKGDKISLAFKDQWAVPDVAYFMIQTGESTGQLAEMMSKVSSYYQELHRNMVSSLKAFIEPITIILLATIVGVILMAVLIPMFGLYSTLDL